MSRVLILSESEVESLLPMAECIDVMEDALRALARGDVAQPLRSKLMPPGAGGLLGLMPAYRAPYFGLKEVCVVPGRHVGAVLLHSAETGELLAIINAETVTAIRTAAVSAVATRLLAREDASVLTILGTGTQAKRHREAIPLVRPIRDIRMVGRNDAAEAAVRGADIVVTATSSREPVVRREWLSRGVHINAVGSSIPTTRELDAATVAAASLFVDRRESTVNESGDYLFALREGAISGPDHIRAELGEILAGTAEGRQSTEEITLFKSLGLAIEDLAAAAHVFEKAGPLGTGTWVEF